MDYQWRTTRPSSVSDAVVERFKTKSSPEGVEYVIDHFDREAGTQLNVMTAFAGKFKTRCTKGFQAKATTAEAGAYASCFHAKVNGPQAEAAVKYGVISGASAYANASLARAEVAAGPAKAGVGVGLKTGAKIGPLGVSAHILGFGFSFGLGGISVSTPLADVAVEF